MTGGKISRMRMNVEEEGNSYIENNFSQIRIIGRLREWKEIESFIGNNFSQFGIVGRLRER